MIWLLLIFYTRFPRQFDQLGKHRVSGLPWLPFRLYGQEGTHLGAKVSVMADFVGEERQWRI